MSKRSYNVTNFDLHSGMTFYLVVYFLNEEEKKPFAVVPNTSIAVGTNRCEPIKSYVGKVVDFLWGTGKVKENYPARILYTRKYTMIMASFGEIYNSLHFMSQMRKRRRAISGMMT